MEQVINLIVICFGLFAGYFSYRSGKEKKELDILRENEQLRKKYENIDDKNVDISQVYDQKAWR